MRNLLYATTAAGLLVGALMAGTTQANAGMLLGWSTTGTPGSFTTLFSGGSGSTIGALGNTVVGNFTFNTLSASSDSPGTPNQSEVVSESLNITNNTAATQTIFLSVGDIGFTAPSAPPNLVLDSAVSGTTDQVVGNPGADVVRFQSFVDPTNGQNNTVGVISTALLNVPAAGLSWQNADTAGVSALATPYSMTEIIEFTLGANSELNFNGRTTLTPVPEPASLALLGVGLLGVGFVARRKRSV